MKSRVDEHSFLQKIINDNVENKVYIKFTTDKSFVNNRNRVTEDMPKELVDELDFGSAISLYVSFPKRKYVRFILLENGNLLMLGIPKGFELLDYKFEELMTQEEKSFLSTSYKSFKLFDKRNLGMSFSTLTIINCHFLISIIFIYLRFNLYYIFAQRS